MMMTKQIIVALLLMMAGGVFAQEQKPNVLFIVVDDLRPELGCYGQSQILSPNIDRLADEGVLFERAYCNIPVCGASRASLMTGLRPTRWRFWNYSTWTEKDAPDVTVLPQLFKDNGYKTISNEKVFHHFEDRKEAWDERWKSVRETTWRDYKLAENRAIDASREGLGPPFECAEVNDEAYKDGKLAKKAIADLKKLKASGEPFFLAVGFSKPHLPFNAPKKYWDLYERSAIKLPENNHAAEDAPPQAHNNFNELRSYAGIPKSGPVDDDMAISLIHGYYACVSYVDAQVGKVLDALKELELDRNTIVILFGDHGWSLDDHGSWCKHSNYEVTLRAPMIIKSPGMAAGKRAGSFVEFVDIYPTLADLCGLEAPDHLEGRSMRPLLEDPSAGFRDFIIAKWFYGMTVVNAHFAYTEWSKDGETVDAHMLFDHHADPHEFRNISNHPEKKATVGEMQKLLRENWGDAFLENRENWF